MSTSTWHAYCQQLTDGVRWERRYLARSLPGELKTAFRQRAARLAPDGWQVNIVPASNAPRWLLDLTTGDLSPTETARLLGVVASTVRSYVQRGLLTPIAIAPGRYRYMRTEVEALRANRPKDGRPVTTGDGLRRYGSRGKENSATKTG